MMNLLFLNIIDFKILDILDIFLVALLAYYLYRAIRGTSSYYIVAGILAISFLWIVMSTLDMELMTKILGHVLGVGVIALVIVFQPEIRRFLLVLGNRYLKRFNKSKFMMSDSQTTEEVLNACQYMSNGKIGALIVITQSDTLDSIVATGDRINGVVSERLIETIFFKNSPLHDGAIIITDDRIVAARCLLPTTDNINIPAYYGTRHRAALGMSEASDAKVVVVSEQNGKISYVRNGHIERGLTMLQLKDKLIKDN